MRIPRWSPCLEDPIEADCRRCESGPEDVCRLRIDQSQRDFRAAEWRRRVGLVQLEAGWETLAITEAVSVARAQRVAVSANDVASRISNSDRVSVDGVECALRSSGLFDEPSPHLFAIRSDPTAPIARLPISSGTFLEALLHENPPLPADEQRRLAAVSFASSMALSIPEIVVGAQMSEVVEAGLSGSFSTWDLGRIQRASEGIDLVRGPLPEGSSAFLGGVYALALLDRYGYDGLTARSSMARRDLMLSNVRLVASQARTLMWKTELEIVDLFQEGVFGLSKALDGYDPYRGFALSTYAVPWIRQTIQRAIHDRGRLVRLPVHIGEEMERARRLARDEESAPGSIEVEGNWYAGTEIESAGTTLDRVRELLSIGQATVSLEAVDPREPGLIFHGDLSAEVSDDSVRTAVGRAVASLTPVEQFVVRRRYGFDDLEPSTLESVGGELGLTRERVRQIQSRAIKKLEKDAAKLGLAGIL